MAEAKTVQAAPSEWMGGVLPFGVGHRKLGMWLFIASDSMTFSALIVAYSYVRAASGTWPVPFHLWPSIVMASVMTLFLLSSSLTMVFGVEAAKKGDARNTARFMLYTMLGGIGFLLLHLNEWRGLMAEGVRLTQNPWGAPLFGATFFTLTGLHMAHVASGVIYLGVIARGFSRGRYTTEDVEISGLYWHFVDLVWMFIFPLVYLLSVPAE
jgi:cytochrome c oxidase subunit 3